MPTIALALALWALRELPASQIRQQLSPLKITGASAIGWPSLRRWARAYGIGAGTLRERAARYAQTLLGISPLPANRFAIEPRIFAAALEQP